jgi:uncharacterized Zn-finger protein
MPFGAATPTPALGPDAIETLTVTSRVLACDGGAGALGHPRVWLRIVERQTYCPYCSRVYVLAPGAGEGDDTGH